MFFEDNVSGSATFNVSDTLEEMTVYTDADVSVAFFSTGLNSWGPEIEVTAPGDFVAVCSGLARITGTARVVVC